MSNRQRGHATLKLDGKDYPICLTLGAMAEIETRLGLHTPGEVEVVLNSPTQNQLVEIVHCLINWREDKELVTEHEIRFSDNLGVEFYIPVQEALAATMPTDGEKKHLKELFPKKDDPQNGQAGDD